jgi:hypothetical protein
LFAAWGPAQPNGGGENHVALDRQGAWHDWHAGDRKTFICEWDTPAEAADCPHLSSLEFAALVAELSEQIPSFQPLASSKKARIPPKAIAFVGHRYYVFLGKLTWHQARQACAEVGGHLVRIESPEEQAFLFRLIQQGADANYWTDLSDEPSEGIWTFSNGTHLTYANWRARQPDNHIHVQHAAAFRKDGTWDDDFAGERYPYLCEWDQ